MDLPDLDLVRVFEHDPELLDGLAPAEAAHLRTRLAARRTWAPAGPWRPELTGDPAGHLGMLVVEGLIVRTVCLAGRECSEIVGPGDVIRPWSSEEAMSVECTSEWRVLQPAVLAALDSRFAVQVARWPTIMSALMDRATRRCQALVYQATIAHVRHAETRLLLILWHLADRWGRVTPRGVVVPVPLTHQLLAQLTCLQRPTVSAAVSELGRAGEVSRLPDGGWLLHGAPPQLSGDRRRELVAA